MQLKGSQLGVFSSAIVYCYLEFKLHYLKNLKLFTRRKIITWAYSFANKGDGFLLFLKAFFWDADLWEALGDFMEKKNPQNLEGDLDLTKNRLSRNKMWCAVHNHNYMCHICVKGFLDSNFNCKRLLTKCRFFTKLPQISHTHKNRNFKSVIGKRKTNCFYPINFRSGHVKLLLFWHFWALIRQGCHC